MAESVVESPDLQITDDLQPEQRARRVIDHKLRQAGWIVQNYREMNLGAGRAIAVREFATATGPADYLLYVAGKAIGTIEAKKEGETLRGVEPQADRYAEGFSQTAEEEGLPYWDDPLPFHYITTGTETLFTSRRDPIIRPREVFHFHQPDRLVHWLQQGSLRQGARQLPPLNHRNLRQSQIEAITGPEESLRDDRPRALVEMTVGGGKTIAAVAHAYRLLRFGQCERVLFLVDRRNLGQQARDEFVTWQTPDDGRKFGELYPALHRFRLRSLGRSRSRELAIDSLSVGRLRSSKDTDGDWILSRSSPASSRLKQRCQEAKRQAIAWLHTTRKELRNMVRSDDGDETEPGPLVLASNPVHPFWSP